jgi:hypothetical protein
MQDNPVAKLPRVVHATTSFMVFPKDILLLHCRKVVVVLVVDCCTAGASTSLYTTTKATGNTQLCFVVCNISLSARTTNMIITADK